MAEFPDHYTQVKGCPPAEAAPADLVVYRVVGDSSNSKPKDYESHYERDSALYPSCEHRSLSVWTDPREAALAWKLVNQRISSSKRVAEGQIRKTDGVVLNTPCTYSDVVLSGHYDWWVALGAVVHPNFKVGKKMGDYL